jgi:hypothetical protein
MILCNVQHSNLGNSLKSEKGFIVYLQLALVANLTGCLGKPHKYENGEFRSILTLDLSVVSGISQDRGRWLTYLISILERAC